MRNYTVENLISVNPQTISAGALAIKIGDQVFTYGTSTDDADATASDILAGKTAYVNGSKITGSISSVSLSSSNNTVTITKGYVGSTQTVTIA